MTDIEKIRAEIERLFTNYSSENTLLAAGVRQALISLRSFINSLPEEPVRNPTHNERMSKERFAEACKAACNDTNYRSHNGMTETRDDYFVDGVQWADEHPIKEPVSENLEEAAVEAFKQIVDGGKNNFLEIFKAGAQWQYNQLEKNRLAACDKQTDEEREREQDFCDKIIIGEHRQPTFSDAIEYGIKWQKEQMMKDAVDAKITLYDGISYVSKEILSQYKPGDKVKVIIVKEE